MNFLKHFYQRMKKSFFLHYSIFINFVTSIMNTLSIHWICSQRTNDMFDYPWTLTIIDIIVLVTWFASVALVPRFTTETCARLYVTVRETVFRTRYGAVGSVMSGCRTSCYIIIDSHVKTGIVSDYCANACYNWKIENKIDQ